MTTALSAIARFVDRRQRWFFPAPAVAVLFLIVILPIAFNLYMMFTKWTIGLGQPRFIGLDNFVELWGDDRVWNGVKVMVYFSGASLALELALGLMIAIYFNRTFRGSEAVQAIYIIPFAATPVAVALIWRIMLNPEIGVINYLLRSVGLPPGLWVSSEHMVVPTPGDGRRVEMDADDHADRVGRPQVPAAGSLRGGAHRRGEPAADLLVHHPAADPAGADRRPDAAFPG